MLLVVTDNDSDQLSLANVLWPIRGQNSLAISVQRGYLLENARRYDEAIEQLNRVVAVDKNHYQAH